MNSIYVNGQFQAHLQCIYMHKYCVLQLEMLFKANPLFLFLSLSLSPYPSLSLSLSLLMYPSRAGIYWYKLLYPPNWQKGNWKWKSPSFHFLSSFCYFPASLSFFNLLYHLPSQSPLSLSLPLSISFLFSFTSPF